MLEALHIGYRIDAKPILEDVSCAFAAGQMSAIIGPNGAGKTTLLGLLAGIRQAQCGTMHLANGRLDFADRRVRARHIAYLPQFQPLVWPMCCRDIVALGRLPLQSDLSARTDADRVAIDRAMHICAVTDFAARSVNTLSGGERTRVLLARLLAAEADILLLDEPVKSLDPAVQLSVMQILRDHATAGCCVVMVLHDLGLAARFCDAAIVLQNGRRMTQGPVDDIFTSAVLQPIFNVDLVRLDGPYGVTMQAGKRETDENRRTDNDTAAY